MRTFYIYILTKDGVAFYIGLTENAEERFKQHKQTYGDDIAIEIKESYTGSIAAAIILEDFWIKKYADLGIILKNKHLAKHKQMVLCKMCSSEVIQPSGRRKKEFCNSTCRSRFWQKQNRGKGRGVKVVAPAIPKAEQKKGLIKANPNSNRIAELEFELTTLGNGSIANSRRKWIFEKISELNRKK